MIGRGALLALALAGCAEGSPGPDESPLTSPTATAAADATRPALKPVTRTFRDWYATCDNGNDCFAYTGTDAGGWLIVRQTAGPEARPEIVAGAGAFSSEQEGQTVSLVIDGTRQALVTVSDDPYSHAVPATDIGTTLAQLASARTLAVRTGDAEAVLPTAGASAALLWIDEKQGRLDTPLALIRRGERPASSVPRPPALPEVVPLPAIEQGPFSGASNPGAQGGEAGLSLPAAIEALPDVKQCRADTAFSPYLQKAVLAARLSPDTELWGVPCDSGAYNAMYDFYISGRDGTTPRKAAFPGWEPRERTEGDIAGDGLINPVFDARTNTLRHFFRGRGIGDCGLIQSWAWTGEAFVLTEETSMGNCWGMPSSHWPTIWRTR